MLSSLNTTITPPSISMQTLVICAGVAFVIMCLAVTITCIKLLHQSPPATPNSSLTDSIKQELFHALVQHHQDHHSVPTPNHPVEQVCQGAPLSTTRPRRCFVTHDELRQAVLDYSRNPTDAQSDVAMRYGWPIGNWCVSQITDFSRIFKYSTLNEPLNHWDVSNARTVERMFYGARNMNQNLTPWNVEKVRNFRHMFAEATSFAGEVSTWNVSNAVDMDGMFDQAVSFQGDVSAWKVDRVRNMHAMFRGAVQFDSDLSRWNTAQVTDMARMFRGSGITGSLSKWSVSKVTRMDFMFEGATRFDDDLSAWDVSGVRTTKGMFLDATAFSHNLCAWGKKLPHKADAARMFEYTVSCPAPHDGKRVNKLVLAGPLPSPLCHVCE